MQFQQDWPKDKKITALLIFWPENSEKYRSTEHYGAPLEGSTIFLCRSSLGSTAMESCRLPELKYAIFSRAGRKTKKITALEALWSLSMGSYRHQNRCEVMFFLEGETHASQIWPTLRKSYTISTQTKSP